MKYNRITNIIVMLKRMENVFDRMFQTFGASCLIAFCMFSRLRSSISWFMSTLFSRYSIHEAGISGT